MTASFFFLSVFISDVLALAPELRTKPFSEATKLEFELVTKMMSAAGEIRSLIEEDNARENPMIRLNLNERYFPNGEVEIDNVIHTANFKCSDRDYYYALFHFKKENKDIKAIFIRDYDKLTDKDKLTDNELAELGVKTAEDRRHFFNSPEHPALKGVWFMNSVVTAKVGIDEQHVIDTIIAKRTEDNVVRGFTTAEVASMLGTTDMAVVEEQLHSMVKQGRLISYITSTQLDKAGNIEFKAIQAEEAAGKIDGATVYHKHGELNKKYGGERFLLSIQEVGKSWVNPGIASSILVSDEMVRKYAVALTIFFGDRLNPTLRGAETTLMYYLDDYTSDEVKQTERGLNAALNDFRRNNSLFTKITMARHENKIDTISTEEARAFIADTGSRMEEMLRLIERLRSLEIRGPADVSDKEAAGWLAIYKEQLETGYAQFYAAYAVYSALATEIKVQIGRQSPSANQALGKNGTGMPDNWGDGPDTADTTGKPLGAQSLGEEEIINILSEVLWRNIEPYIHEHGGISAIVGLTGRESTYEGAEKRSLVGWFIDELSEVRDKKELKKDIDDLLGKAWFHFLIECGGMLPPEELKSLPPTQEGIIKVMMIVAQRFSPDGSIMIQEQIRRKANMFINVVGQQYNELKERLERYQDPSVSVPRLIEGLKRSINLRKKRFERFAESLKNDVHSRQGYLDGYSDEMVYSTADSFIAGWQKEVNILFEKLENAISDLEKDLDTLVSKSAISEKYYKKTEKLKALAERFEAVGLWHFGFLGSVRFANDNTIIFKDLAEPEKYADMRFFAFGNRRADGRASMINVLGKKGANLQEMARLGISVPPGFTIPQRYAQAIYYGRVDEAVFDACLERYIKETEARSHEVNGVSRVFGDKDEPLFLAVRSGAKESEPGRYLTVLPVGLCRDTLDGYAKRIKSEKKAYTDYIEFMMQYPAPKEKAGAFNSAMKKVSDAKRPKLSTLTLDELEALAAEVEAVYRKTVSTKLPTPHQQIKDAIRAVFASYEPENRFTEGSAVNVQEYMFGDRADGKSYSGVVFSRDLYSGLGKALYGKILKATKGRDVVMSQVSIHSEASPAPMFDLDLQDFKKENPAIFRQLEEWIYTLETHFKNVQDVEIVIEDGRLFLVQTRSALNSATPLARLAILFNLANDGIISRESVAKDFKGSMFEVPQKLLKIRYLLEQPVIKQSSQHKAVAKGVPIIMGIASGKLGFGDEKYLSEDYIVVDQWSWGDHKYDVAIRKPKAIIRSDMGYHDHVFQGLTQSGLANPYVVGLEIKGISKTQVSIGGAVFSIEEGIYVDGFTGNIYRLSDLNESDFEPSDIMKVLSGTLKPEEVPYYRVYEFARNGTQRYKDLLLNQTIEALCLPYEYDPLRGNRWTSTPLELLEDDSTEIQGMMDVVDRMSEREVYQELLQYFQGYRVKGVKDATNSKQAKESLEKILVASLGAKDRQYKNDFYSDVYDKFYGKFEEYNFKKENNELHDTDKGKYVEATRAFYLLFRAVALFDANLRGASATTDQTFGEHSLGAAEVGSGGIKWNYDVQEGYGPRGEERERLIIEMMSAIADNCEGWIIHGHVFWVSARYLEEYAQKHMSIYPVLAKWVGKIGKPESIRKEYDAQYEAASKAIMSEFQAKYSEKYPMICKWAEYYRQKYLNRKNRLDSMDDGIEALWDRAIGGHQIHHGEDDKFTTETISAFDAALPWYNRLMEMGKDLYWKAFIEASLDMPLSYYNNPAKIRQASEVFRKIVQGSGKDDADKPKGWDTGQNITIAAEADRIHTENTKREHMPTIADKEMLCHIVTDTILPSDQRNMLKVSIDQAMDKKNKHVERVAALSGENVGNPDKYTEDLRSLIKKKQDLYTSLGYTKVRFTLACPDVKLVDKVLRSGLDIKALAFEPCDSARFNLVQVEGIILALRALDSDDLAKLKNVYAFLAKHALSPEDANIADINTFIRKVIFILPAAKVEDYELKRTYHYLANQIWQAA